MVRQLAAGTFLGVFLGLTAAVDPPIASAGPVEELVQLAVNPADPDMMVLRYEYSGDGLLYTRDGGRTFKFVCGSSIDDPSSDEGPLTKLGPIGVTGDSKVLMGVFGGLWVNDGQGCSWTREGEVLLDRWVTDIVPHPSDPEIAFLITSNGGEATNGVVRRNADGSFTELGEKKAMLISRLRVAELPGGGLRFYESAVLGQIAMVDEDGMMTTKPNYAIRVSDDEGETWTEHELGVLDGSLRLEAVDPTNPDRIVASISRDIDTETNTPLDDYVMVSDDQGESFEQWTTVTRFGGIAFSPEGEVWLGDAGHTSAPDAARGIKHAASLADEATVMADGFPVNCVKYAGDELFVCQRFSFGRLSIESGEFTPALELSKLESMNECEGVDTTAVCRQQMCTGYCGLGHFATAPMCEALYDSNEDRGCAPLSAPEAGTGGTNATSGTGGSGAVSGAGGTAGAAGMNEAGTGDTAGEDGDDDASGDGGGCAAVSAKHGSRSGYALLGMLAIALGLVRRRRVSAS